MSQKHQNRKDERSIENSSYCENLIKALVDYSPIPQFVIDREHRVQFWNEALEKYSGIKAESILGTDEHWKAFYPNKRPCLVDLLIDEKDELIPEIYKGKYIKSDLVEGAYQAIDFFPHMGKSGVWLSFTASLIKDEKGFIIGSIETLEDITKRIIAEENLRKSESKYRNVFELANDGILLHTLTTDKLPGRFFEVNQAASRMLGYERDELINMGPTDIVPEDLHYQLKDIVRQARKKDTFIFETLFLRKDDSSFPVETSTHLVDYDGEKIWISHIRDITERKRMEEALKGSEDRFRELFNSMKSGVAVYRAVDDGKDFEFIDFNHSAERLENINKNDVIGRRVTEVFPGVREFGLLDVFRTVWLTGKPENHPVSQYKDDRIQSWRENFIYRLPSGEIVAIYEDLSEKKIAEQELKENEKKYRDLVENISDVIFTIDLNGKISYISPVVEKVYGYAPDKVINRQFLSFVHPDDLDKAKKGFKHRIDGHFGENSVRILAKDGIVKSVRTTQTPIIHNGIITGFNYILTDLTERVKAEEALKESREKYRTLVENISDVIFTLGPDGKITYISPVVEDVYGYNPDEVIGGSFENYIHPDDLHTVRDLFSKYIKGGRINKTAYVRVLASDGSVRFVRATHTPVIDGGDIKEFNFILTDLTDRKITEEALSIANKKLNILSSITRHDILNAIMAVRGYTEMSEDLADDPKLKEYIQKEIEAVNEIQHQIEFTRFYQDIGIEKPEWWNAGELFDRISNSMDLQGIIIENKVSGIEIYADPLIEKVFYNLIDNSIRHGETVTVIGLSCSKKGDDIIISYRDNGVGISEKDREKLFRKGFGKHTGLGLFLSREILAITGMTIIETGELGKGVNFEILVPKGGYRFNKSG